MRPLQPSLPAARNTSLLGNLRAATGLDDLDVVTDSEGNAAVRAGRYISDNVYLGVEAGAQRLDQGHDQPRHHRESEGARRPSAPMAIPASASSTRRTTDAAAAASLSIEPAPG